MVQQGKASSADIIGNDLASTAVDLRRRRQVEAVSSARRDLVRARRLWFPVNCDPYRFSVAVSRSVVNTDGRLGTALDPLCWSEGGQVDVRRVGFVVQCGVW